MICNYIQPRAGVFN